MFHWLIDKWFNLRLNVRFCRPIAINLPLTPNRLNSGHVNAGYTLTGKNSATSSQITTQSTSTSSASSTTSSSSNHQQQQIPSQIQGIIQCIEWAIWIVLIEFYFNLKIFGSRRREISMKSQHRRLGNMRLKKSAHYHQGLSK